MAVVAQGLVCAAGRGIDAYAATLRDNRSALTPNDWSRVPLACSIGRVAGIEDEPLPPAWADWDCRATRLAWSALQSDGFAAAVAASRERWGAARIGLVLGTSASTIAASELAYRETAADGGFPPDLRFEPLHTLHGVTDFVARALAIAGPSATVGAACASSAKAYAQAERWLRLGLADAVVVGGVDALSESLLFGFHSLQLVDAGPCRPCDPRRAGISVGEAAGFALLQRGAGPWMLLGHGEANDAHHMSAPHPQGLGAELALDAALARAGLDAAAIDYLSLHATATPRNDTIEAALVARRYAPDVHASATKGACGHTMGASGMLQALACGIALRDGLCAGNPGSEAVDPAFGPVFARQLHLRPAQRRVRHAASHAFGFGGNNCVLVFGAAS